MVSPAAGVLTTVKGSPQQMWLQLPASKTGWAFSPVYDSGWCLTAPSTTAGTAENWWGYLAG